MQVKGKFRPIPLTMIAIVSLTLSACGNGGENSNVEQSNTAQGDRNNGRPNGNNDSQQIPNAINGNNNVQASNLDVRLATVIQLAGLVGDASINRSLPSIDDPLPQLGKKLFFSKSLGGDFDSACVSCHHPMLGGGDQLSLPVGVNAIDEDLLGPGRTHAFDGLPNVPRNSPTVFNSGLWDTGLFLDSRVESLGKELLANGTASGIRTPDSNFGLADTNAGDNLVSAQAGFPVTSIEEMRSLEFEPDSTNAAVRDHLAERIGGYGDGANELQHNQWLDEFQAAYASSLNAENLITFASIAAAIGEYERSMLFVDNPFSRYVRGDISAISAAQKRGAILFYGDVGSGGAGCANCHSGDFFSDGSHHTVAFPQFGPGKGDANNDDFGRERESNDVTDRYRFRVPSLLNVEVTAPYGHSGAYDTLDQILAHYNNPAASINNFFNDGGACRLSQFDNVAQCAELYPDARTNSANALSKLQQERRQRTSLFLNPQLNINERHDLVAFLRALTDPCVLSRECMAPWIADVNSVGPDTQQLNAIDVNGNLL